MNEKPLFVLPLRWVNPVLTIQRRNGSEIKIELICFEATKENRQGCDNVVGLDEETEAARQGQAV